MSRSEVIILAGGLGTRLRSVASDRPKPFLVEKFSDLTFTVLIFALSALASLLPVVFIFAACL